MKYFRKIVEKVLTEAKQVGTLYHATTIDNLLMILKDNELISNPKIKKTENGEIIDVHSLGISTSRNKLFMYNGSIELMLDGNKLSEKYKVIPYNYFDDHFNNDISIYEKRNTAETIILSKEYLTFLKNHPELDSETLINIFTKYPFSIKPLDEYLIGIMLPPSIFASKAIIDFLKRIVCLTDKPIFNYRGQKLNTQDLDKYHNNMRKLGKVSKQEELDNLGDNFEVTNLNKIKNMNTKEIEFIQKQIENDYKQNYNDIVKNLSSTEYTKLLQKYYNKYFLTKDNNRWYKF